MMIKSKLSPLECTYGIPNDVMKTKIKTKLHKDWITTES